MRSRLCRSLSAVTVLLIAVGLCQGRADDAEATKERLSQAKKVYDAEVLKFKMAVLEALTRHEDAALKAADKTLIDQAKMERDAFEKAGELPSLTPIAVRGLIVTARTQLDEAYAAAIKECLQLKADDAAAGIKKEYEQFQAGVPFGNLIKIKLYRAKITYENDIKKFRDDVGASFDKREATSRKEGNKKLLDQIKAERKAFNAWGELPKTVPAALRQKPEFARATLEKAYTAAIKGFTKAKQDDEAETAEKEFQAFSKLIGSWHMQEGDREYIFVFRTGGGCEQFRPSGEPHTTGEWRLEASNQLTIALQNGFKVVGAIPGTDTAKADVFAPGGNTPISAITLRRVVK